MPSPASWLVAIAFLAFLAPLAPAQQPASLPQTTPVIQPELSAVPPANPPAAACPPPWHADLIFGVPAGLRIQRELFGGPVMLEGFVGLELIFPTAGVGVRCQGVLWQGRADTFLINPGVDAYLIAVPPDFLHWGSDHRNGLPSLLTADLDLLWRHSVANRLETEVGLKVGAGVVRNVVGQLFPFPVAGIYLGFRF